MRYRSVEERDALVKALENDNCELVKIIQNYRQIGNKKFPEINEDEWDDPKNLEIAAQLYWEHRAALENIIEYSTRLKNSIDNFLEYFPKSEEEKKFDEYIRKTTLARREKDKNG